MRFAAIALRNAMNAPGKTHVRLSAAGPLSSQTGINPSSGALDLDHRQVLGALKTRDHEPQLGARSHARRDAGCGARAVTRISRPRLEARTSIRRKAPLADFARRCACKRRMWTMLVVPTEEGRGLLSHLRKSKSNEDTTQSIGLERPHRTLDNSNTAVAPDRAEDNALARAAALLPRAEASRQSYWARESPAAGPGCQRCIAGNLMCWSPDGSTTRGRHSCVSATRTVQPGPWAGLSRVQALP